MQYTYININIYTHLVERCRRGVDPWELCPKAQVQCQHRTVWPDGSAGTPHAVRAEWAVRTPLA